MWEQVLSQLNVPIHTKTPRKVHPSEHEEGRPVVYTVPGNRWWWQAGTQGGTRVGTDGWCIMVVPVLYLSRPSHTHTVPGPAPPYRTVPRHGLYRTLYQAWLNRPLYPGWPKTSRLALDIPPWQA